jgi:ABC-type branched-subunit amino acid transport system substrate-binding protein
MPAGAAGTNASGAATADSASPIQGHEGSPTSPGEGGSGDPEATQATCSGPLSPIRIGSVGTQSGIIGATIADSVRGLQAWAAAINDRGGIACHPVELVVGDDGGDPARHRALVQEFVEQRGVIAFAQLTAPLSGQAAVEYLESVRVPAVGSEGGSGWFYSSPMYFPQMTSGPALLEATLRVSAPDLVGAGTVRLGTISCQEAQFCTDADRIWNAGLATEVGLQPVFRRSASLAQPSFISECLAAKNADVQVFAVAMDVNSVTRLAKDCAGQGFRPTYLYMLSTLTLNQKDDPNLDGAHVVLPLVPWFLDTPALHEFRSALEQHAPGLKATTVSLEGWTTGKLLEAAGRSLPAEPTSEDLLRGLWAIDGDTLGGLTNPLRFAQDAAAAPAICGSLVTVAGGSFESPTGTDLRCP